MIIQVTICKKDLRLETFVIPGHLPLLFSRHSIKQFELQLDIMRNMIIIIDRVSRDLEVTHSGPYVVDLRRRDKEFEEEKLHIP